MILSRRLLLAAAGALPKAAWGAFRAPVGINIYSLRYLAEKNLAATLALIGELGFREVEVGDLYGRSPAEFRRLLEVSGLKASSLLPPLRGQYSSRSTSCTCLPRRQT